MPQLLIPLNDTIVVSLGARGDDLHASPRVVQVTCKAERPDEINTITTYYLVQHELSELILRIIGANLESPIPRSFVLEGDRYTLYAKRAPWNFGKKVTFLWGDDHLVVGEDKWTFSFRVNPLMTLRAHPAIDE